MTKTIIAIRDVEEGVFTRFKASATKEKMKLGDALTSAMSKWVNERETNQNKKKGIDGIKPVQFGGSKTNWSSEVDKTVYGDN